MPKKSKVNKLAKMSDEERARYLQHRADVEEEARRRKRELIARFIKNKLDKEESYSRMNNAKLNQTWRFFLRRIKCKQMALEIKGKMDSFTYMMERKDRLLTSLLEAIDVSDEQHRRGFQAHTETLNYFIGIGSERLQKLQAEYEFQKNALLENWDKDYFDITGNQDRAEFKLQLIIFIQNNAFRNSKGQAELEAATSKNDARLEHEAEMWNLRRPKELEVEYYWSKLKEVYSDYLGQHGSIMDHYQSLAEKDDFYQRDIARNELQIQQATESLKILEEESLKSEANISMKIKKMNAQKENLLQRYRQLKTSSKSEQADAVEKLTVMVNVSQDAIQRLEDVKEKLMKIKQMAEICKKYEKNEDNATIFPENETFESEEPFQHLHQDMVNECKEYMKMEKFFLKMNRVKVQTLCLKAEQTKLTKENIQLKNYIKRYLTELALNNGNANRPGSVRLQSEGKKIEQISYKINRPVTCIEGVLSNAVIHEKRMKIQAKRNKEEGVIRSFPRIQCWMQAS